MSTKKYPDRSPGAVATRRARIVELSKLGYTVPEICAEVGVSPCTVVEVRKSAGVNRYSVRPFTMEEERRAKLLLESGCSYQEVARTLGRHHQVIGRKFPGYAWTIEQRTEYTNMLRDFGLIDGSKATQEGMWRDKKRAQAERLKREAAERSADEIEMKEARPSYEDELPETDLAAELRVLNRARTTGADRIVAYCDACGHNGRSPVLGVYRMAEEAEEQSEQHRVFTAKHGWFDHDPYEYDLFEHPLHAQPEYVIPLLRQHFWRSSSSTEGV